MDQVQGSAAGISLEEEKASLMKRLDEMYLQEIQDFQGSVREKQKLLEDTKSNFMATSQALEKEIAEIGKRRLEVKDQLVSFREEKNQEIEDLTLEVHKLVKKICGESTPLDWTLES